MFMFNRDLTFPSPLQQSKKPLHLAKASLPLEGRLYDKLTLSNFVDLDAQSLTFQLNKTIPTSLLSTAFDADLPAKFLLSARPGTISQKGANFAPVAKASFNVRLLDLGTSESHQKGFLKFKYTIRSNGRRDHGFEIDRKLSLFGLPNTTLYGNVTYRTNSKTREWKTKSSFGIHQDVKVAGIKCTARIGLTPEGHSVVEIKI